MVHRPGIRGYFNLFESPVIPERSLNVAPSVINRAIIPTACMINRANTSHVSTPPALSPLADNLNPTVILN